MVFWLRNLTDKGPLQHALRQAAVPPLLAYNTIHIGNLNGQQLDGLIDEVRLSSHVLTEAELLINQIPPVPLLPYQK